MGDSKITSKIDEIDAKILKDLFVDARKSFAKIARECHVSTANISGRFADLEKAGIIIGSTLQLDYKILGYNTVCDISIKTERQHQEEVVAYINSIPHIYGPAQTKDTLSRNIHVVAILKDITELDKVKDIIKRNRFVKDLSAQIWTDIKNIPENLEITSNLKTKNRNTSPQLRKKKRNYILDEIDLKIIDILSKNSRESFQSIAQQIGSSIDTASRRVKNLVENNIMQASIQIDPRRLGYHASAMFELAFSSENDTGSLIERLISVKDCFLIIKTSGNYDLHAFVMLRDIDQFMETRKEIVSIPGITRAESTIDPVPFPFLLPREYITTF